MASPAERLQHVFFSTIVVVVVSRTVYQVVGLVEVDSGDAEINTA